MLRMLSPPGFRLRSSIFLIILMPLFGCAAGNSPTSAPSVVDVTGNWQIQSAVPASGSLPATGIALFGALSSQGTKVTGTFRVFNFGTSFPTLCGQAFPATMAFSGTIDSSRLLTLLSADGTIHVALTLSPVVTGFSNGTINSTGTVCNLAYQAPAFGAQVAPVNGTYAGSVTAISQFSMGSILAGTSTLALTQATTPNADGQFAVTGTLSFTGGGCTANEAVSGTASGVGLQLTSAPVSQFGLSEDHVTAGVNALSAQLIFDVLYGLGPCAAGAASAEAFQGTLTKQ